MERPTYRISIHDERDVIVKTWQMTEDDVAGTNWNRAIVDAIREDLRSRSTEKDGL